MTIVVGAGASSEYGLPLGSALRDDIVSALQQREVRGNVANQDLYHAMSEIAKGDVVAPGDIKPYVRAVEHINDSLCQSPSIDNFINSHKGNLRVEACGKLAIAKCILDAERRSALHFDDRLAWSDKGGSINFNSVKKTWLNEFFGLINRDCPLDSLKSRLGEIALIVFNYDRCVEQFLLYSIVNFYRVDPASAADLLSALEIHHPYGSIGSLASIPYGSESRAHTLLNAITSVRTFSESTTLDETQALRIKELTATSQTLLFLGFGYIPLNMELLSPNGRFPANHGASIFATAYGMSPYDQAKISSELKRLVNSAVVDPQLTQSFAAKLFGEYTRGIRF